MPDIECPKCGHSFEHGGEVVEQEVPEEPKEERPQSFMEALRKLRPGNYEAKVLTNKE